MRSLVGGRSLSSLIRSGSPSWVAAELGFGALARVVAFTLVSHLTNPYNLGRYVLLTAVGAVVSEVGSLGLSRLGVRFVAANREQHPDRVLIAHVGFYALVAGVATAGVTLLGGLVLFNVAGLGRAVALPFALWVGADAAREGLSAAQRGTGDHRRAAWLGDGGRLAMLLVALAVGQVTLSHPGLLEVVWLAALASLATALIGSASVRPQRWRHTLGDDELVPLLDGSLGTVATGITSIVGRSAELWIAGLVLGAAGAGRYAAGARTATVLALPAIALATVASPRLAGADGDTAQTAAWLVRMTRLAVVVTALLAGGLVLVRSSVLDAVLGGDPVGDAPTVLLILAASQVCSAAAGPGGTALIVRGAAGTAAVATIAATAAGLLLAAVAGLGFDAEGLAGGVAIGLFARSVALGVLARRRVGLPIGLFAPRR